MTFPVIAFLLRIPDIPDSWEGVALQICGASLVLGALGGAFAVYLVMRGRVRARDARIKELEAQLAERDSD